MAFKFENINLHSDPNGPYFHTYTIYHRISFSNVALFSSPNHAH